MRCPAEYERNEGLFIAWDGYTTVLTELAVQITNQDPEAIVYIAVDTTAEQNNVTSTLTSAGADMDQVEFMVCTTDTVWMRDYGPRFVFEDGTRTIIDHTYNRPRYNDNDFPDYVASTWGEPQYDIPLTHGGGNFHLFTNGEAFMSDLILTENPGLSEQDVIDLYAEYQGVDLTIYPGFPTSFDSTQHIDMWMLPVGDDKVIIGEYAPSTGQPYTITENAVADFTSRGYTVYRTPGWNSGGTHYTYTNAVIINDLVLIPAFQYSFEDSQARQVFQTAMPDHTVIQVDCSSIIHAAGAIHCIVMHIPSTDIEPTIALDSGSYGCESTAAITVTDWYANADGGSVETVSVTVTSNTDPTGEVVLLTETGVNTARFEGTLVLSTSAGTGILQVSEYDTVTAEYTIDVFDTASVDCTAPLISNVQTGAVGATRATITLDTDEPATATVRYGLSCGALTESASTVVFAQNHAVELAGLDSNTTYFYAVDAADEAENTGTDDNGGQCYSFSTPDVPDYFTQQFFSGIDLDGLSLTFTPAATLSEYDACVESITALPIDPSGGIPVSLDEDESQLVPVSGASVSLYGVAYTEFYIADNGHLTFTGTDADYTESIDDHFDMPRISALFDDFSTRNGGTVSYQQLADRMVVTYENVPEYQTIGANTFQIELHFDGTIVLSYLGLTCTDAVVGLSEGLNTPPDFVESDLSVYGVCGLTGDLNCDGLVNNGDIDAFVLALNDQLAYAAAYPDCDYLLADCNGDGQVNNGDIDPFVALLAP